jgi:hypothetical protein
MGMTASDAYAVNPLDVDHWKNFGDVDEIPIEEFEQGRRDEHPNFGPELRSVSAADEAELHKQWSVKNASDFA